MSDTFTTTADGVLADTDLTGHQIVITGAASIVWAAVAPEVADNNGSYIANCSIANALRAAHASSDEYASRLWRVTEELIATTS